ncbi:MAG TPA: DUF432 domain-containing protein [Balneolaceae bacterium]|nr:DUF432 domain-containing protein [Balneolaceae bacterium]
MMADEAKHTEMALWGTISLQDGEVRHWRLGDLHLWITFRDEEIWITHGFQNELKGRLKEDTPPANLDWTRWATRIVSNEVRIMPVFPDMPLVVNSEYPLKVSPGASIKIFARISLWVRVSNAKDDYQLTELPTVKLSRTWFGSPIEGELCYYATTTARRDLSKVENKPNLVQCPIQITNQAEKELNFEHFCLRVERLSMYQLKPSILWADETQIVYHGEDLNSDVIMTGKLAEGVTKNMLLTKPRRHLKRGFGIRTFKHFFEDILFFDK